MSPFVFGLILLAAGLAGVFWGYRVFRVVLPVLAGIAGYLIALNLFPNSLALALLFGFGLAIVLALMAYVAWSLLVTFSGVFLGGAFGAAIAVGLNLSSLLGWIVILLLAVLGGILVWKIRDEVVIILTAVTGAAFVATGIRVWLGTGSLAIFLWLLTFIVFAAVGIAWQWRRYRNLDLLGIGGPAEMPAAKREGPVVDVAAALSEAADASAAPEVVAESAAPFVGAAAAAAAEEAETPAGETVTALPVEEEPVTAEVKEEPTVVEAGVTEDMSRMSAVLDGTEQSTLQQKIDFVEGVGSVFASKLNAVGIQTVLDLLQRGATPKGRAELVETTGIAAGLILKWVNHADLFRVKGVGGQFGELLEASGVDTVPELAQRNPLNLFNKLSEVNAEKNLAGRSPRQDEVESWVAQAKNLPRVVEY